MDRETFKRLKAFRENPPFEPYQRLKALKNFSQLKLKYVSDLKLKNSRRHFNQIVKKSKKFIEIKKSSNVCWVCGTKNIELLPHHIVLLKNGGTSTYYNLIFVCKECHKLIHFWIACNFRDIRGEKRIIFGKDKFYDTIPPKIKIDPVIAKANRKLNESFYQTIR